MTSIEKLEWLTDRYEGMGISYAAIARHVHCDPSTLARYVNKESQPNKRMTYLLEKGLKELTTNFMEHMCNND